MSFRGRSQHVADRERDGRGAVPADAGAARGCFEAEAPLGRQRARVDVVFGQLRRVVFDLLHRRSAVGLVLIRRSLG